MTTLNDCSEMDIGVMSSYEKGYRVHSIRPTREIQK